MTDEGDSGDVVADATLDVQALPDSALRGALEFAVGIAFAGQKLRPPLASPAGLRPFLKLNRLDRQSMRAVRRAIVGDPDFRGRIGSVATADMVDPIGVVWLQQPPGWQQTVVELHAAAQIAAEESTTEAALRRAEKRREAAELASARAHAEMLGHHDALARERSRADRAAEHAERAMAEAAALRTEFVGVRREAERLRVTADSERARADVAEGAADDLRQRLAEVEAVRDEILAREAAARSGIDDAMSSSQQSRVANNSAARALRQAAAATRNLADALANAGTALLDEESAPEHAPTRHKTSSRHRAERRTPIAIPGGVYGDSVAATLHLLRTSGVCVVVDGYNVAKLAWPQAELIEQRQRCIDLLEDVVRRFGTDVRVVFDGAEVVGASAGRRLIRVQYSPPGVTADDVIRADVAALSARTPVVVVTNDQAIVNDVRSQGANIVTSDGLLAAARRAAVR